LIIKIITKKKLLKKSRKKNIEKNYQKKLSKKKSKKIIEKNYRKKL